MEIDSVMFEVPSQKNQYEEKRLPIIMTIQTTTYREDKYKISSEMLKSIPSHEPVTIRK